jgi:NAD(P)H-dependent FMN reductase
MNGMENARGKMSLKVLAVSGSMQEKSNLRLALSVILNEAARRGAQTHLLDLQQLDLPMFRPGVDCSNQGIVEARERVAWANVIVLGTPDYHGSMSGAMKNFLDYHWRDFAGKLFGYVCTSHEKGLTAMDQMRTAVRQCYGWSLPYGTSFDSGESYHDGEPNENLRFRLNMMARDLVAYGTVLAEQFARDLESDETATFAARYRK